MNTTHPRHLILVLVLITVSINLVYQLFMSRSTNNHVTHLECPIADHGTRDVMLRVENQRLRKQRNELSVMLNSLQERHQQLVCSWKGQKDTSDSGGWCDYGVVTGHDTDKHLAASLAELFANQSVVGLGDGRGEYRQLLLHSGGTGPRLYRAFDGAPNINRKTRGQVGFLDLTLPQYWLPTYDWVVCLEVIEHIPARYEHVVLDNVARAAGVGAVISWAVPGQHGFHHVNCRSPQHVRLVMGRQGFHEDHTWTRKLRNSSESNVLKNNVVVFRKNSAGFNNLL